MLDLLQLHTSPELRCALQRRREELRRSIETTTVAELQPLLADIARRLSLTSGAIPPEPAHAPIAGVWRSPMGITAYISLERPDGSCHSPAECIAALKAFPRKRRTRKDPRYLLHLVSGSSQAEQVHGNWDRYLRDEWRPTRSMYGKEPPARVQTIEKAHLRALLDQEISGLSPDLGFDYLLTAARELGMAAERDEAALSRIADAARDLTLRPIATREEPLAFWM